jgi:hypothetical protein
VWALPNSEMQRTWHGQDAAVPLIQYPMRSWTVQPRRSKWECLTGSLAGGYLLAKSSS